MLSMPSTALEGRSSRRMASLYQRGVRASAGPAQFLEQRFGAVCEIERVDARDDQRVAALDVRPHGCRRDAEVAERHFDGAARARDAVDRSDDFRGVDLPHLAKARRQVVRAEQHSVDARNAHDRVDVLDGTRMLGLYDDRDLAIRRAQVLAKPEAVALRAREPHAARSEEHTSELQSQSK